MDNPIARLTWQVSQKNKFAVYYDRALRLRAAAMTNNTDPATASVVWNTPIFSTGSAKWTSTLSSQILLEAGVSYNMRALRQPLPARDSRRAQHPGVVPERPQERPQHRLPVERLVGPAGQLPRPLHGVGGDVLRHRRAQREGRHAQRLGHYRRYNNANGDLYQTYTGGVPTQVTVLNTPLEVQENMDGQLAAYVQDSWRWRNFTFNYGVRYDRVAQSIVGQEAQTGRFTNMPAYDDFEVPTWSDFSPRTSVVWDIFGNGKTAVRTGFNRFMTAQTTGFARLYAPTALTTAEPAVDRRQRRRHRPGRARLHLPDRRLRDQLRQPGLELRHPRAVHARSRTSSGPASTRSTSA